MRERLPGEARPDPCGFGCRPEECWLEDGDPEAEELARTWALCGGRERRCWPRGGGLLDQDALVVSTFGVVDAEVGAAEARAIAAATAAAHRGGR